VNLHSGFRRGALLVAFVMTASTAHGQVLNPRPFRSIFRTTDDPANSKHRLDVTTYVSAGHDDGETTVGLIGSAPDPIPETATYGYIFARATYAHDGRKMDFSASGSTSTRYYNTTDGFTPMWVGGNARLTGDLGRHGQYLLNQTMSYSPYYVFSLTPEFLSELSVDAPPDTLEPGFDPDTDLRSSRRATYRYDTRTSYTHQIGRYTRASVNYGLNYVDSAEPAFDLIANRAGGRITREVGRYWDVYGGYGLRVSTYRDSPYNSIIVHDLDSGVRYNRALPFSVRTRVAFSVSSSLVNDGVSTRFRINGNGLLSHVFSRTWVASAYYRRDNDVLYGFLAPFVTFSDSIGGLVIGKVAGPVYLTASGAYSRGSYSALSVENVVNSSWAVLRVHVPIMWLLSTYVEGYYSQYDFDRRIGLLPSVPTTTDRLGIRAGVTFLVPVLR
jgi:hypothetical protein